MYTLHTGNQAPTFDINKGFGKLFVMDEQNSNTGKTVSIGDCTKIKRNLNEFLDTQHDDSVISSRPPTRWKPVRPGIVVFIRGNRRQLAQNLGWDSRQCCYQLSVGAQRRQPTPAACWHEVEAVAGVSESLYLLPSADLNETYTHDYVIADQMVLHVNSKLSRYAVAETLREGNGLVVRLDFKLMEADKPLFATSRQLSEGLIAINGSIGKRFGGTVEQRVTTIHCLAYNQATDDYDVPTRFDF